MTLNEQCEDSSTPLQERLRSNRLTGKGGIYAVCSASQSLGKAQLTAAMQSAIKRDLNPLFKIHDVVLIDTLPRTASNKVMRRVLRDRYASSQ